MTGMPVGRKSLAMTTTQSFQQIKHGHIFRCLQLEQASICSRSLAGRNIQFNIDHGSSSNPGFCAVQSPGGIRRYNSAHSGSRYCAVRQAIE